MLPAHATHDRLREFLPLLVLIKNMILSLQEVVWNHRSVGKERIKKPQKPERGKIEKPVHKNFLKNNPKFQIQVNSKFRQKLRVVKFSQKHKKRNANVQFEYETHLS